MIPSQPIWVAGALIIGLAILGAVSVELLARGTIPLAVRQSHNDVASAMFCVIGTTYAVLLAFVAMLAFEGFHQAQAVTDTEASLVRSIYQLTGGLSGPQMDSMRSDIESYARSVAGIEWPLQAEGKPVPEESPSLDGLMQTALHLRPETIADGNVDALLLNDLTQLASARRERLLAARSHIPSILWVVLVAGGGITIVCGSFLDSPSLRMHLALSTLLATSGALVLLVVVTLSNPFRGDFRVSPAPFEQVLTRMGP